VGPNAEIFGDLVLHGGSALGLGSPAQLAPLGADGSPWSRLRWRMVRHPASRAWSDWPHRGVSWAAGRGWEPMGALTGPTGCTWSHWAVPLESRTRRTRPQAPTRSMALAGAPPCLDWRVARGA
jgi:hypothetical protein